MKHKPTLATTIAVVATFFLAGSALAGTTRLTFHQAKVAIRQNAMLDNPSHVTVDRCYRDSRSMITCYTIEQQAHTLIYINGVPAVGTLSGWMDAQLKPSGRVAASADWR